MSPPIKIVTLYDAVMSEMYDEVFTSVDKAVKYLQEWDNLHVDTGDIDGEYYIGEDGNIWYKHPTYPSNEAAYYVDHKIVDPKPGDFSV